MAHRTHALVYASILTGCVADYPLIAKPAEPSLPADTDDAGVPDAPTPDRPAADDPAPTDTATPAPDPEDTFDPAPADDCDHTSSHVYVLSRGDDTVYTFDPVTTQLTTAVALNCSSWSDPGSMAVTRDGQLFVRYADQTIHGVDLQTSTCTQTPYSNGLTGFGPFGMGFATTHAGTWRDDLYIANGSTIARLDTATWQLSNVGAMPSQSELTGNAAGELWAFLPLESPAAVVRKDQATGATLETIPVPSFPPPINIDAFAFAVWNDAFYLFVREYGVGNSSDVYKVERNGQVTQIVDRLGIDIVGAGVSTCAP